MPPGTISIHTPVCKCIGSAHIVILISTSVCRREVDEFRLRPKVHAASLQFASVCMCVCMYTLLLFTFAYLLHCQTADLRAKMVIHMARDAWYRKKNFRFYHCFGDEDGMKHLKCCLAKYFFCAQCVCTDFQKWSRDCVSHFFVCDVSHVSTQRCSAGSTSFA